MFLENLSKYDFETTVSKVNELVLQSGWSLLHKHNINEILASKGFDVLPVAVLEVCKAPLSAKILSNDDDRAISVLMPCRISIYSKTNGDVLICRMDAAKISSALEGEGASVMSEAFNEMERILEPVIK